MLQKIKIFILAHKIISIIVLIGIVVGSYFIFRDTSGSTKSYITEEVKKGDITTTVTGAGQVEASNTITLKPGTSGDITYVGVKVGQEVKAGALIASVDSSDAKMALLNSQISLAKLTKDPDSLTLLQKENSLTESYNSGWNNVSLFINDMSSTIIEVSDLYNADGYLSYKNNAQLSATSKSKVSLGEDSYYEAKKSLDETTKLYKSLTRSSSQEKIKDLIDKSYETAKIISNTVKNTETAFNYSVKDLDSEGESIVLTTRSNITSWLSSSNSYVNSLLSSSNGIKESIISLSDFVEGTDPLDIKSAELSLESKQKAYNDCFVRAPIDGIIGTLTAKIGESSGSSVGTLITKQKVVTIPLNEVDIASIKLGQKVTLAFDAISDLSVSGLVSEIDSIGTVSSGVVTYNVKISFDSKDERIKPGMSVSAEIITNEKKDILTVSSGAVKTKSGVTYIEIQNSDGTILKQEVEIGISDDTLTEIISGLNLGDVIISKTITGTTSTSTTTSNTPSLLNSISGKSGMAGARPRD